ncbi:MAG TPA: ABC transporter permease [Casimicrobiaceae bacterium]|nr:ABC transporter permease [Casimicrobiaceae bacterium]
MNAHRSLTRREWLVLTCAGTLAFFGIWALASLAGLTSRQFLPPPWTVAEKFVELTYQPFSGATLQKHLLSSFGRFGMGFALAVLIGIPLGLILGWFRWADAIVSPLFDALRFVAPIAWVPFAALWFGTGIGGPVLIIFTGAFPPCVINAHRGARYVDQTLIEAARTLGARHWHIITEVLLPASVPSIVAGLRVSAGLGWQSLVGAELIVASSGIGYVLVKGQASISTSIVMSGMIAIGIVGFAIDALLRRIEVQLRRRRGDER